MVLSCLAVLSLKAQVNRYGLPPIHNYHHSETGGGERNWGITQDRRGVIYVANDEQGILEYDGTFWRVYAVPGNVSVRSVLAADDGFVYTGLEGDFGRLEPGPGGTLSYRSLLDSAQRRTYAEDDFWRIYEVEGKIYFSGRSANLVYDAGSERLSIIDLPDGTFLTFFIGTEMYISNAGSGLLKHTGEQFVPVRGGEHLKGKFLSGLVSMEPGQLLASTFNHLLYLIDTRQGTVDSTFLESSLMENLSAARIIFMQRKGGNIYTGTREQGLFVFNEKWELVERYSENEGLLDNAIPFFIFDRDKNGGHALWIAHWKGVSRVDMNSPFRSVSIRSGIGDMYGRGRGDQITDLEQFGEDLYISTLSGIHRHLHHQENMRLRPLRGIRGEVNDLQLIHPVAGKEFLLAAGHDRTYVFDPGMQVNSIPEGAQKLLVDRDDPGRIYLGGEQLTAFQYSEGQWQKVMEMEAGGDIRDMCQDGYGLIWIHSRQGLHRLELRGNSEPVLTFIGGDDSSVPGITGVFTEPEGEELLAGTREGLYRYNYLMERLLYDSVYNSILPEGRNNIRTVHWGSDSLIWISFENVHRDWRVLAARKTGSGIRVVHDRPFRALSPRFPTGVIYTDPDDELWLTRGNELIHFDGTGCSEAADPPGVLIRKVWITGDSLLFDGVYFHREPSGAIDILQDQVAEIEPRIRHHYRDIEFQWSSPYYEHERHVHFSHQLEGFSDSWSQWTPERSARYTNLPYGRYVMQVKARNVFGDESEPVSYAFTILRPWYSNVAALLVYVILLASLVIFVLIYTRKLRARAELLERQNREIELQKTELEQLNEEITLQRDEIEAQRDSIADQKELIDRQNLAMTDSIKYARRIQDAMLPAGEVMQYLLPKHFVFYRPRDIVSGDFYWVDKKDETVLIAVADCTGHGVPGAFMSMLGISLLNETSGKFKGLPTHIIMDELRDQVIAALGQTGERHEAKDGIEMSLLAIQPDTREIQFTGANQDLWVFREGKLEVIRGDRMPVGIHSEGGKPFTAQSFQLNRGDVLYMVTDGYPDQFGGQGRKKYGTSRMRDLLGRIQTKIMHDQKVTVEKEFEDWKGDQEQIDDVLMIGIKL